MAGAMKLVLASTPPKVSRLIKKLDGYEGMLGLDTEVSAPQLQGRDFINITYSALLGVSIALEDEECYYLPIRHRGSNATFLDLHNVLTRVQAMASKGRVWAHNAKFDHQVFIRAGYPMPGLLDSMVAAWLCEHRNKGIGLKLLAKQLLDRESPAFDPAIASKTAAEVLEYACHDALNTLQLGQRYTPQLADMWDWFLQECAFAHSLAEMKLAGIGLDRKELINIRREADAVRTAALHKWEEAAPGISITSSKQLQELFTEGTWRTDTKTGTGQHSTSAETMKQQLTNGGPGAELAQLRLDFQEVTKIVNTYTDGLIEEALQWGDKKLHPDLFHFGTVTGRLSSSHPNIQNQPAHGDWAKRIKECFIPDPGMEFTSADYSQIELRYFADYCGGNLLQAFVDGKDLHTATAEAVGVERQLGKTINFGFLLYGGGARKMAGLLGTDEREARKVIQRLQDAYPEIAEWRDKVVHIVRRRGPTPWCKTKAGRVRLIPELNADTWRAQDPATYAHEAETLAKKYGIRMDAVARTGRLQIDEALESRGRRLVVNYLVQGGSRDLLVLGMNAYRQAIDEADGFSLVTTVHDEVLTQHPAGEGETGRAVLKQCLEDAGPRLGLKVPVLAEPKTGKTWSEVK
jgi:DNA polymerase-1